MIKRKKQHTFWKKVKSKYKLSFFNENTLEEVWTFRVSRLGAFTLFSVLILSLIIAVTSLIIGTPLKNLLPGYLKSEDRAVMIDNSLRIDSLSHEIALKDAYIKNIAAIITGNISIDSISSRDTTKLYSLNSLKEKSPEAAEFVKEYEKEEKYTLHVFNNNIPTDGLIFFTPVKGSVKKSYNPSEGHFGIDIQAAKNAPVSAILDGTVIFAAFTAESGYVIEVQHSNNFISMYLYNAGLLKKVGDRVNGGEKIALAGYTPYPQANPDDVEIQLWHLGKSLDPKDYISF